MSFASFQRCGDHDEGDAFFERYRFHEQFPSQGFRRSSGRARAVGFVGEATERGWLIIKARTTATPLALRRR
jgi:hypothetical protein